MADYYATAQGKQGAALVGALHEIVRNGHVDRGYRQAREALFSLVDDPGRNDSVVDVYSGRAIPGVDGRKSAFDRQLNAEHTWPQSKGARGIAQSDLHQLMASDIDTNGRRGNLPYAEVDQVKWTNDSRAPRDEQTVVGVDEQGREVCEPRDAVKGDIARALMYFYVRYDRSRPADYTLENFRAELPTLVKWHEQDPVDDRERQRNEDVYSIQRNRNPFIDHPEWVTKAGFPSMQFDRRD